MHFSEYNECSWGAQRDRRRGPARMGRQSLGSLGFIASVWRPRISEPPTDQLAREGADGSRETERPPRP
jgi:hypothetical protein